METTILEYWQQCLTNPQIRLMFGIFVVLALTIPAILIVKKIAPYVDRLEKDPNFKEFSDFLTLNLMIYFLFEILTVCWIFLLLS